MSHNGNQSSNNVQLEEIKMSRGANKELEKTRKEPLWGAGKRQWQSRNKF